MSMIVTRNRVILGVKATLDEAIQEAHAIDSKHASIVELRISKGFDIARLPIGYLVVPTEHACCACGQHVPVGAAEDMKTANV